MTTPERWNEVADRWVKPFVGNWSDFSGVDTVDIIRNHWQEFKIDEDKPPRVEPERLQGRRNLFKRPQMRFLVIWG